MRDICQFEQCGEYDWRSPFFTDKMTDLHNLLYTSTREIPTLSYTLGPELKVHLSGTSVDDGTHKSNNCFDQWQSDKLGTGSRV